MKWKPLLSLLFLYANACTYTLDDPFSYSNPPIKNDYTASIDTTKCFMLMPDSTIQDLDSYERVQYDSSESVYYVRLTQSEKSRYRLEDQPFVVLYPKRLLGGTIAILDTPQAGYVSIPSIVSEYCQLENYR